jgi:arylsulfatase A-like enzyme
MLLGLIWNVLSAQDRSVIVIVADDLGVDYLDRYGLGSDPAPTPVLDSLADNGILFTNAWTNPICSPSRANILTGKYGFRTGIGTAITSAQNTSLDTTEYTIAKAVSDQAGAATAMVGKWHLGHNAQAFRRNPNACGFDHYAGNVEGQLPSYTAWQKTVNGSNTNVFQYATTVAVNDAINWIEDQSGNWMLFLTFNAPHEPFHRPPNNLHSFDGITTNPILIAQNPIPHFKAMVEAMDTEIGRLLGHLASTGQLGSTDIIFLGDNGSPAEVAQPPFEPDKVKASLYNGGVRVPLIISGPSVIDPGRSAAELVNSTDLFHTILEIMGGDVADLPAGAATDSRSIVSILTHSSDSGNQRAWIYGDLFKPTTAPRDGKAITDGIYKLIEFDNGSTEFYHTAADLFETVPLDINALETVARTHYDFLCGELGELLDTNFCRLATGLDAAAGWPLGLFPNPAGEFLYIRFPDHAWKPGAVYEGRIFDTGGRMLSKMPVTGSETVIPVGQLPPSIYHFQLTEDGKPIGSAAFIRCSNGAVN